MRRERLAGRCLLAELARDPDGAWSQATRTLLSQAITRAADRALFPTLEAAAHPAPSTRKGDRGNGPATAD